MMHTPPHKQSQPCQVGYPTNPSTPIALGERTLADVIAKGGGTPSFTPDQVLSAGLDMSMQEVLFVRSIGRAITYADLHNRARLAAAFPELVRQYMRKA